MSFGATIALTRTVSATIALTRTVSMYGSVVRTVWGENSHAVRGVVIGTSWTFATR